MIILFLAIVASLVIIVWWEFSRARGAQRTISRAIKRHLESAANVPQVRVPVKEVKRGFDNW
jgi:hypothetical protein